MTTYTPPTSPSLQGISHIALSVGDLPAAQRFWTEVMGFETMTQTPEFVMLVGRPQRIAIVVTNNGRTGGGRFDESHPGLDHLAFAVADADELDRWRARLEDAGVVHSPITDSGAGLHLNLKAPDGLPIELFVMAPQTAAEFGLAGPHEAFAGSR